MDHYSHLSPSQSILNLANADINDIIRYFKGTLDSNVVTSILNNWGTSQQVRISALAQLEMLAISSIQQRQEMDTTTTTTTTTTTNNNSATTTNNITTNTNNTNHKDDAIHLFTSLFPQLSRKDIISTLNRNEFNIPIVWDKLESLSMTKDLILAHEFHNTNKKASLNTSTNTNTTSRKNKKKNKKRNNTSMLNPNPSFNSRNPWNIPSSSSSSSSNSSTSASNTPSSFNTSSNTTNMTSSMSDQEYSRNLLQKVNQLSEIFHHISSLQIQLALETNDLNIDKAAEHLLSISSLSYLTSSSSTFSSSSSSSSSFTSFSSSFSNSSPSLVSNESNYTGLIDQLEPLFDYVSRQSIQQALLESNLDLNQSYIILSLKEKELKYQIQDCKNCSGECTLEGFPCLHHSKLLSPDPLSKTFSQLDITDTVILFSFFFPFSFFFFSC